MTDSTDLPTVPQQGLSWLGGFRLPSWLPLLAHAFPSSPGLSASQAAGMPAAASSSHLTNGGILGSYFATIASNNSAQGGGILQGLFSGQAASDAPSPTAVAPLYIAPTDALGASRSVSGAAANSWLGEDLPSSFTALPTGPGPIRGTPDATDSTSWPGANLDLASAANRQADPLNSRVMAPADRSTSTLFGASLADSVMAQANNGTSTTVDIPSNAKGAGSADSHMVPPDSYARAAALIAADYQLNEAARAADAAGDKDFRDRWATIIANIDLNPDAARDAVWREVYASGLRSSASGSLASAAAEIATEWAARRLEALHPDAGILWARDAARDQLNSINRDQQQTLYRIANTPVDWRQKLRLMSDAGLFDQAFASGPLGNPQQLLNLLSGGLLGMALPPGGPRTRSRGAYSGDFNSNTPELLNTAEIARTAQGRRRQPGLGSGAGSTVEGPWLLNKPEAPVPVEVADQLRSRKFSDLGSIS